MKPGRRADDGDGARGFAQVLRRERGRRALTVLDLEQRGERVAPTLTAYVYIDDRAAAGLARILIAGFGFLADRKLGEGLGGPIPPARRHRIVAALPARLDRRTRNDAAASVPTDGRT